MKTLIKGGDVVLVDCVKKYDVLLEDDKIIQLASGIECPDADNVIDATGKTIIPGVIDIHVHLREPGYEGKEDIESGSKAAVAGGVTQLCCMPNTDPVCDNAVVVKYIKTREKEVGLCKINPIGAITKGEKGETLADIGKMATAGAVAISDDGRSVMNSLIMRRGMEYASGFNMKCLCHCEDIDLVDGGVVNEGKNSTIAGLKGSPRAAEDIMIARDISLAESLDVPVHICHVSTYSGVDIIRSAKKRGVKVTAETCPHYFILTDDIITGFDTFTKVNPPVREEKDRIAIIEGLKDGTLDCIVTDHAPHSKKDKEVEYNLAAFGMSGIETSFALSYTYLVRTGIMSISSLMRLMSYNPAKTLSLEGGEITVGAVADLVVVDLNEKYVIDSDKFLSKGKNTPFNGYEVYGKVCTTIVNGQVKYQND